MYSVKKNASRLLEKKGLKTAQKKQTGMLRERIAHVLDQVDKFNFSQLCRDAACSISKTDTVVAFLKEAVARNSPGLLRSIFTGLVEQNTRYGHSSISSFENFLETFHIVKEDSPCLVSRLVFFFFFYFF